MWGDLDLINFVDNTRLSQNQMAWLQGERIRMMALNAYENDGIERLYKWWL